MVFQRRNDRICERKNISCPCVASKCLHGSCPQIDDSRDNIYNRGEKMFKCFIETNKNQQCLAQLIETEGKIKKEKIKCLLAMHYFKPLALHGKYVVDNCHGYEKCEMCNEPVKADQTLTSFGNSLVWHGQGDIVVARSVVQIELDEALHSLSLTEDEEDEDVEDCKHSSMAEEPKDGAKTLSQAIAQAIVNAFCVSKRNGSLFDKFIPSFLATEKNIRIILYNCKFDKLLLSTEFPIWDGNQLNTKTMMQVWVTINYVGKMGNLPVSWIEHRNLSSKRSLEKLMEYT